MIRGLHTIRFCLNGSAGTDEEPSLPCDERLRQQLQHLGRGELIDF